MLARSPRGRRPPSFAVVVACAMLPACAAAAAPTSAHGEEALHAWEGGDSPAALEAWVQDRLRRADADVARVLGAKGARSRSEYAASLRRCGQRAAARRLAVERDLWRRSDP